jgi:DNA-binding LytR/AlgR family response regulator
MYNVALCEDEKVFAEEHERICREILNGLRIEHNITTFGSSTDFLEAFVEEDKRYDLFLLDVLIDEKNGVELAQTIRKQDEGAAIVYITSSPDYWREGFNTRALHYLEKPLVKERLEELIWDDYKRRFQNVYCLIASGAEQYRVAVKDIVCLETVGRKVAVTLTDQTLHWTGKLPDLLATLPQEQFVLCHQAYAVNINNVKELTKTSAITIIGKEIPVSRSHMKDVTKALSVKTRSGNDKL